MGDDLDVGVMRTPIWTLDTLTSTVGTTLEMTKEVTLLHPDAQSWLREARNTQQACVGGATINVQFLFSHLANSLQIRDVRPSSAERIAKSLLTTRGFLESYPPVVYVMKQVKYKTQRSLVSIHTFQEKLELEHQGDSDHVVRKGCYTTGPQPFL